MKLFDVQRKELQMLGKRNVFMTYELNVEKSLSYTSCSWNYINGYMCILPEMIFCLCEKGLPKKNANL